MKSDLWEKRLRQFKEQEKPETVLVVSGNSELTRAVVAWMGIEAVRKRRLTRCDRTDDESVWRWLWRNVDFPEEWFYRRIPERKERAEQNFAVLVANRVLYPDGGVNGFVERYLRKKVLSLFGVTKKSRQ